MKTTIELTDQTTKFIVNNIYPLYLHDLSGIWGWKPNKYGVYEESDIPTLTEQNKVFDVWWEDAHTNILFPYLIRVDGIPAGLAFVATPPYTPHGTDYYMNEFFVLQPFRAHGVAQSAANQVFDSHRGSWEVQTNPTHTNLRAQAFWTKTIQQYTSGAYHKEVKRTNDDGDKLIFSFQNK
ncbi:GNAT family N-acetyltransferase [Paenibacillus daejeonensis]|uniref:GNAT family N-acetyltransferase n=1 Tax=Paenibacillus daejeonensis TaxID=135193 RepID=UPI0003802143|nr:hypothetical protein [Paenibacillus daejeonensis]